MVLHLNGETEEFTVPLEFHDVFAENLKKQKRLNKEVRNLIYKVKKFNYKNDNMLIRLYFKKVELSNIKNELLFMLNIFSQENLKKILLDEILTDLDNDNFSDLV